MIIKTDGLTFVVGYGINHFSMERGSFNYKEKIEYKSKCRLIKKTVDGDVTKLFFEDKKRHQYILQLTRTGEKEELELTGNIPEDVNRFWITLPSDPGEHIYGCGETYSELDLKGQKVRIWVAEHQNSKRIGKKIIKQKLFGKNIRTKTSFDKYESYYAQPTFTSSDKYYMHIDTNEYAVFDFSRKNTTTFYLQERPHIYAESAATFEELSYKLTQRLGKQRELPDWVYDGGIIPVQDWKIDGGKTISALNGCTNVTEKIKKARDAGADIVGVWCQDWCGCRCTAFGYQVMWNFSYDKDKYPDLPENIKKWEEEGVRFLGYINPFLAIEKDLYREAHEKGYLVKNKDGEDYLVTITTFPAAMIDLTNPDAYEWYKQIIKKNMIGIGMKGWMADFGEYLPVDAVLYAGEAASLHNRWPAIWARLNYEAIKEEGVEDEVFFFTRAGHTKTIAYSSMMWTGDQHVDFSMDDGLGSVITAQLSLAMSGFGFSHSDVGGYTTIMHMTRSKELLLRWIEMNAFSPLFRGHEGNQPGRNIQFDHDKETLKHIAKYTKIHHGLKFYIQALVEKNAKEGTPVIRPIFYHYDEDRAYTEKSEYLLGTDLLIAPVLEEQKDKRKVYLPQDTWIEADTGKEFQGGEYLVKCELGRIPVFVRKDSKDKERLIAAIKVEKYV